MKVKDMVRELIHFDIESEISFTISGDVEHAHLTDVRIEEIFDDDLNASPVIVLTTHN